MQPLDPDQAPIAAVDRFSEKAAHLQVRTADNHLPGPNEPVDFDTGPFITQGLSPTTGKPVRYYNFDVQGTAPAPVYVLYREGEDKPVADQLDIIDTLPGETGYNDFRQVWKVSVPKDYVANTITNAAALLDAGYKMEQTGKLRNMPVVPDKSTRAHALERRKRRTATRLVSRPGGEIFQLRRGAVVGGRSQRPAVADLRDLQRQSRRAERRTRFRFPPEPNSRADP